MPKEVRSLTVKALLVIWSYNHIITTDCKCANISSSANSNKHTITVFRIKFLQVWVFYYYFLFLNCTLFWITLITEWCRWGNSADSHCEQMPPKCVYRTVFRSTMFQTNFSQCTWNKVDLCVLLAGFSMRRQALIGLGYSVISCSRMLTFAEQQLNNR